MKQPISATTWDTTPLYPSRDSVELEQDFELAAARCAEFRDQYRGQLAELDAGNLHRALVEYEKLIELLIKPQMYGQLLFAGDSQDDGNKLLSQRAMEFGNQMSRELLFFDLEIIRIPDARYAELSAEEILAPYRHYLENLRKFQPHTLSEVEESLLKQKNLTGVDAFSRLFDEVSAAMRFSFEIGGEERECTGEELLSLLHDPDALTRERAFGTFLKRHEEQEIVFTSVFNTIALDHAQEMALRNYSSPMEPTNLGNELTAEMVERMMTVSEDNYPMAREYLLIKAKLLQMERLKNTDIYAPVGNFDRQFSYEESRDLVLRAYGGFSQEFRDLAETFFSGNRIDRLPRQGKSGGAFCMGITPHLPPYLLLNFTGNLRDVATMAHEVGHGIHYLLAGQQSMLNYHPPLPLAETASVFGEMLLTRELLEAESDREMKISLLCAKIEDIIATTFRQNVLTRFEEKMHLERKAGLLTATRLCDIWWEENLKLYGDAVEMIEPYRWGWSYISHFIHTRFYCYSYTFAELLVLSLYQSYVEQGESYVPIIREILASGGSQSPADTVKKAGKDLSAPDFWQKGYDLLGKLLEELRSLV